MSYAALAVAAVGAGYKIYDSSRKKKEAKKIEKNTRRPVYNKPGEVNDVYNLMATEVNDTGLQDYVTQQTGLSEANGIDAILKSGGKADFATIHSTYGSQLGKMLQQLKSNRANNIASFNNAAYAKGRASDTEFQYNQDAPYKDAMQLKALLLAQSEQSKADAINMAATGAANYGTMRLKAGYGTKDGQQLKTDMTLLPFNPAKPETIRQTASTPSSIAKTDNSYYKKWLDPGMEDLTDEELKYI